VFIGLLIELVVQTLQKAS